MDVFDVFLPASSLYTAVLPHDLRPAASKGESSLLFLTLLSHLGEFGSLVRFLSGYTYIYI